MCFAARSPFPRVLALSRGENSIGELAVCDRIDAQGHLFAMINDPAFVGALWASQNGGSANGWARADPLANGRLPAQISGGLREPRIALQ